MVSLNLGRKNETKSEIERKRERDIESESQLAVMVPSIRYLGVIAYHASGAYRRRK